MKLSCRAELAPFIQATQATYLSGCGDTDGSRRIAVLGKACINLDLIRSGSDTGLATRFGGFLCPFSANLMSLHPLGFVFLAASDWLLSVPEKPCE